PLGRRFDFEWILLRVQVGTDSESCGGCGAADQAEDLVIVGERLSGPVLADWAEQAAVNRVVLGGAGGIVGHGDGKPQSIAEVLLELVLPSPTRGGMAAAGVGQDRQVLGIGVAQAALPPPQREMEVTAKAEVSWLMPTNTEPRLACGSYVPNGRAMPVARERKSWSLTGVGTRSHFRPGFLKLPTSSRFLASTLMMGLP